MDNTERIATALERIATILEANAAPEAKREHAQASDAFLAALEDHRDKLVGRMTATQIAEAIGMPVGRSDRVAFGQALTRYGVGKLRSGSQRSYQFGAGTHHKAPAWLTEALAANRERLRGHMAIQAVADIIGMPKVPSKLSELRHNLIALGRDAGGGLFKF